MIDNWHQAAKAMMAQHIQLISDVVNGIMTPDLGLIDNNKITPALQTAFETFLPVSVHTALDHPICNHK